MKNRLAYFLFAILFCLNYHAQAQIITSPVTISDDPVIVNYDVSGSLLKRLEMEVYTSAIYANLSIYADDVLIVDNIDLPLFGNHSLNALVKFNATGIQEIKLVANGGDITVNSLDATDINDLAFPDYGNITDAAEIVDEPSLKYGGPTIADMDNDGNYDLVLNNHNDSPSKLYWSDGDGTFTKQNPDLSLWTLMDLHGSAAGDYDNDGDLDLVISLGGGNGTNPAPPIFYKNNNGTLVRSEAGVGITSGARGRSPRWSDMDLDGDLDLILINAAGINGGNGEQHIFYENLGNGTFQTKNVPGLEGTGGEKLLVTDLNNDHIDDIVLFSPLSIWKGNGDFTFTFVGTQWLPLGMNGTWGISTVTDIDIDNDGDLDLYLARGEYYFTVAENNSVDFHPNLNRLDMRISGSQGTLPFEVNAGGSITISNLDFVNRNGYMGGFPLFLGADLQEEILANYDAVLEITTAMADGWSDTRTENGLYIGHVGNGLWKIEAVRNENIFWSIHFSFQDVNGFTPTGWTPNNRNAQDILLRNDNESFTDISDEWNIPIGGNHWGVTAGDFNNDSYQDLYVHRFGYLKNRVSDYMLLNTGQGGFEITTAHSANNAGSSAHGDMGQAFDFDLDGDVDILNGDDEYGIWHLYDNQSTNLGNYVLVRVGYEPNTNVDPIAAEVTVHTPNNDYFKRVGSSGEAHSQSLLNTIHFGLGDETQIDSITVRWRNGETYVINTFLTVNNLYDTDKVPPTAIAVDPPVTDVREGTSLPLSVEVEPTNANEEVIWSSSNEAAVSVDADGVITGNILGETAVITATTTVGGLVDSCIVTVVEWYAIPPESVTVTPEQANILEGDSILLTSTVLPILADSMQVIWTSSDAAVATVNQDGWVKGLTEGTATIIATTVSGGLQDSSVIQVLPIIAPFIEFDDESIYLNTIYKVGENLEVNSNYHAGSGNTVIGGNFGGIKYWLREMTSDWNVVNDYVFIDFAPLDTESGTSTANISLNNAVPTADLSPGNFYFLWVTFASSNGEVYDKGITGINIEKPNATDEEKAEKINVYPIPATDIIYLSGLEDGEYEAQIFDMKGALVLGKKTVTDGIISVAEIPWGIYILKVTNGKTVKAFKILKI